MTEPVTTSNRGKIYEYYKDSSRTMRKAAEIAVENNNASVDSEGNVRLNLNGAESIVKDHFKYIPKVFFGTVIEELDEADEDAICIIEEYDEDDFEEVELNEIGEQHEREVIRTKVQVQDLGSRTTANLTAKWTCQKGHVSEIRYPRWVEELEHPSQCFGVEEDEEECFDTPTKRVKNSGLKTDVQQLVLGEIDKDDRSSRNVISEVDDPFIGELDRRDKVEVIGRVMMADRQNESKIQPYIHILGYEPIGHNIELTSEKMDELEDIEKDSDDIVSDVVDSVAPEIVDKQGQRLFKKACVLSVLRGANHTDRNMIHSLGYGEKGSGKSKIMEFIEEVTEDSKFSDMQNATGPGLTATAKETSKLQGEGSQWIITSGMIPQTHGSVALLDELDKMDERDQTLISTPMSSGRVIVEKAGEAELKAETSIIATANPEDHSYDGSEPIESLALPQHVIDRFDVMVRVDDEIKDRDKEREMLKKQAKLDKGNYEVPFDRQTLKEYLAYAKEFEPEMSEDANEQIVEHILDLRMDYKESSLTALEISARDQEKLTRLSSAMAKLRLSETVEVEDVDRAWNLMLEGYQSMTFDALNLAKSKIPVNQGDDE